MSLGDALYAELTAGGYTHQDDDDQGEAVEYTLRDALADLGRGQSQRSLARELGIPRSTLQGWTAGRAPKRDVAPLMSTARTISRALSIADREDALRNGMHGVTVTGWMTISKDVSLRTVSASTLDLDSGVADDLVDAYLNGAGPGQLARIFTRAIGEKWYRSQLVNHQWNVLSVDGWA